MWKKSWENCVHTLHSITILKLGCHVYERVRALEYASPVISVRALSCIPRYFHTETL